MTGLIGPKAKERVNTMTKEDLYNGISAVDSEFLREAEGYKKVTKFNWKKWVAAAACLCLLAVAAIVAFSEKEGKTSNGLVTAYAMDKNGDQYILSLFRESGEYSAVIEKKEGSGNYIIHEDGLVVDVNDSGNAGNVIPEA